MPFAQIHERTVQKVLKPPSTIQLDKLHYFELPPKATQHQRHVHDLKSQLGNSYSKMVSHQRQSIIYLLLIIALFFTSFFHFFSFYYIFTSY